MEPKMHSIPLQQAIENAHKERAQAFAAMYQSLFGLRSLGGARDTHHSA